MSAFRQAVLSVAPDRLEQFSNKMKKSISENDKKRRTRKDDVSSKHSKKRKSSSSHDKDSKKRKTSSSSSAKKKDLKGAIESRAKKSTRSRSKEKKHDRKSSSAKKTESEKNKSAKEDSDFDPNDLDLTVPLPTLSSMVKDRKMLLNTAFSIIKGPKLTSMLPDVLKLTPFNEIQQLCEEQLAVMSSKRIQHILGGKEMESSSGTDSSDNEEPKAKIRGPEATVSQSQDHSLQANLIDSTTNDHIGPSMLFPSALSTARACADIPARKIDNDGNDEDNVSTSTEPNLIYTRETHDGDGSSDSCTEEGEVESSAEEAGAEQETETPNIEVKEDAEVDNPGEEVMVEVEEYEEIQDEDNGQNEGHRAKHTSSKTEEMKDQDTQAATTVDEQGAPQSSDPYAGKSQLEILELELRARAIRSLMKAAKAGKLKPGNELPGSTNF